MSCAESLSRHPEKFKVTLIERSPNCGGMATSHSIDPRKYGADYINDGVQGCNKSTLSVCLPFVSAVMLKSD